MLRRGTKDIVFDNGGNAKDKEGTKTSDKAPNFNDSDKEVAAQMTSLGPTSADVSLRDIGCLKLLDSRGTRPRMAVVIMVKMVNQMMALRQQPRSTR